MRPFIFTLLSLLLLSCNDSERDLVISGRIELKDARVGSKLGGRVEKVLALEGSEVQAGDLLVLLEDDEILAQMAQARAALEQAQAQLDLLVAGTRKEEIARAEAAVRARKAELDLRQKGFRTEEVRAAEARVNQAKSALQLARKEYDRAASLAGNRTISQQEMDQARTALDNAQSQLAIQQQQLDLLQSGTRPEEIAQSQALLEQAQAELDRLRAGARSEELAAQKAAVAQASANVERLETQLRETRIVAPAEARVETLDLEPGDLVSPGAPVANLTLKSIPYVRCYVPENRLGWVNPGREVFVTVDSFPDEKFRGRVRFVASEAEFTPRNVQTTEKRSELVFETRVDILESDPRLRPGMFADVHVSGPDGATTRPSDEGQSS